MRAAPGNPAGRCAYARKALRLTVLAALCLLLILAYAVLGKQAIGFDTLLLQCLHGWASPGLDGFFLVLSRLGYQYGVIPVDALIVLALVLLRRWHQAIFAGAGVIGSALLAVAIKHLIQRDRPQLWESIAPEKTFSFPSAHAMGTMTLALILMVVAWPTRWRWPLLAGMGTFALSVGVSRVYLGVHYPSDVIAGWCVAIVWIGSLYLLMDRNSKRV